MPHVRTTILNHKYFDFFNLCRMGLAFVSVTKFKRAIGNLLTLPELEIIQVKHRCHFSNTLKLYGMEHFLN